MIHYINGKLALKLEGLIVVETGGIGYEVNVPMNSAAYLLSEGEEIKIYTAMIVREDDMSLYGFMEKDSLTLFNRLRTVSGIGAKAAMAILSAMPLSEVIRAITFGDAKMLTRANGIGKKSAERVIVDLKDKLSDLGGESLDAAEFANLESTPNDVRNEAISALMELGYAKAEAATAVMGVKDDSLSLEEYIKEALKRT